MKKTTASYKLAIILAVSLCANSVRAQLTYPPETQKWDADQLGNHRAVLQVNAIVRFDAVDKYNSNDPMELIASAEEVRGFVNRNANAAYYLFPELREFPIKMESNLPQRWLMKGKFYVFQLGLWSPKQNLHEIQISFSDFKASDGAIIPANSLNCISIDYGLVNTLTMRIANPR